MGSDVEEVDAPGLVDSDDVHCRGFWVLTSYRQNIMVILDSGCAYFVDISAASSTENKSGSGRLSSSGRELAMIGNAMSPRI